VLLVALLALPSLRGVPPPPLPPPTLLLLLLTSLVLRMSGLLLLLVGSAAAARARVAGVVAVAAGVVVVAAVEVVEVAKVVAAVGVVAGVGALVVVAGEAVGVAVVVVVGVVAVGVELFRGEVLAVARGSTSSVGASPSLPSSFVSDMREASHSAPLLLHLDDAWRAESGDKAERPRWAELLRSVIDIFALDYDAILATMYALSASAEGECYRCVPPDPGIEAAALGACECALPSTAPAEAFTLDSSASRCFFCDSTTLTPLPAPVPVGLADPSGGLVLARSSTVLPCPAVSASGPVALLCSCRLLSHQTLLWHHRLGHPFLPRLRGMHSRLLVSSLPRSLPPLPPCLPCVKGRQCAAPHSSLFPPTSAPLQTLHMDVWGPTCVIGQDCERYFLLVVDDYTRYNMVFPLRSKGEVPDVLIPWIRAVLLQLRVRFCEDLPVLRLHSDRGGEFSSDLLRDFCREEGILHSLMLSASPSKMGLLSAALASLHCTRLHLHEEIWLRCPPSFTRSFSAGTHLSLRRPVYGLRQAPREWHDTLRTTLAALGFAPSTADPLLFLRTDTSLSLFYVLVYVDDLVFATADTKALALVKSELQKRHTCTDLGELHNNLGLQITRDRARRTVTLSQSHMVHQVLERFGFRCSSPQSTPLPTGHSLLAPPSDEFVEPSGPYPELVGCLMYLMTCTRPDLAYPLSILARYVAP
ncbi:unnamed protein product, partial [Closterium sp. NIES-54]